MQSSICAEMQMQMNTNNKRQVTYDHHHHHHLWGTHTHVGIIPNPTDAQCLNPKHGFTRQEPTAQLLDSRLFGANAFLLVLVLVYGHRISENQVCSVSTEDPATDTMEWNALKLGVYLWQVYVRDGLERASARAIRPTKFRQSVASKIHTHVNPAHPQLSSNRKSGSSYKLLGIKVSVNVDHCSARRRITVDLFSKMLFQVRLLVRVVRTPIRCRSWPLQLQLPVTVYVATILSVCTLPAG